MNIVINKRRLLQTVAAATLAGSLPLGALASGGEITVGVTAGPHAQISEVAKRVAEKNGLKVKLVEFTDFIQPNAALALSQVDVNVYQHLPFMEAQNKDRGYKIVPVAPAVRQQMGVYSKRVKQLADLAEGARVGIPNDPTNGSRALLVLAEQGLIKMKDGVTARASVLDIVSNPKKLRFVELEAALLPRALGDLDAAAVNSNYAVAAGLSPTGDSLALENPSTPYVTIFIATRAGNEKAANVQAFVKAYQSPEVKAFVDATFKGAYSVAW